MMKELYLLRHAKSDWENMEVKDIDRPLKTRGIRDALFMGEYLSRQFEVPDQVLTSPACRALHTSILFIRSMKSSYAKMLVNEAIYLASFNELQAIIKNTPDHVTRLMLVGHNPGLTDLANYFLDEFIHNIPTSGFVYFRFETDTWKGISIGNLARHVLHYPKEFLIS